MNIIDRQCLRTVCRVEHVYCLPNIIRVFNSEVTKLAGHVACVGEMRISGKISVG